MKKFAKMSLVAAIAVAGMTTYSSASSLEEAVKNTDISGYLRYRFEGDHETKDTEERGTVKVVVNTKTKVNDFVTAHTQFLKQNRGNSDAIDLTRLYFTYANGGFTFSAGRQGLVSPFTDNNDNSGDGVVSTYNFGQITLAGAYYIGVLNHGSEFGSADAVKATLSSGTYTFTATNNNELAKDHYGIGVIGSFDPVNVQAWYMGTEDDAFGTATSQKDAWVIQADAKVGPVNLYGLYADADVDATSGNTDLDDVSFLNLGVSGNIGPVKLSLDYVRTGDDSGDTTFDGDTDAQVNTGLMVIDTMHYADADFFIGKISGNVSDSVNLELAYLNGEGEQNSSTTGKTTGGNDKDVTETRLQATYKMSKNFTVQARYSFGEDETGETSIANASRNDNDYEQSRIELKYTF